MRKNSKTFRIKYTIQAAYMVKFSAKSDSKNFPLKKWLCIGPLEFQKRNLLSSKSSESEEEFVYFEIDLKLFIRL